MQDEELKGPRPIDRLIRTFLREKGLTSARRDDTVFKAWTESLGKGLRDRARPVRFRSGELTVEVDSAAHLQELKNFTGESFRARANAHLGTEAIRRVAFKLKS